MRAAVLRCAVVGADGGGGLWWLKPMMETACMHVWAPYRACGYSGLRPVAIVDYDPWLQCLSVVVRK
jgi:hypothetical protein